MWYYLKDGLPQGPVPPSELRELALEGCIVPGTSVRKGTEGEWVPAGRVNGLFDPPKADWHFSRDGDKAGPVAFIVLKKLAASGKLSPSDLVWKEGMGTWEAAAKVPGLFPAKSDGPKAVKPNRALLWGGGAALAVVVLAVAMFLLGRGRHDNAKSNIAASQPVPPTNEPSPTSEGERAEAQQREERKRSELTGLREEVAKILAGDKHFRAKLAEQQADTLARIGKLGGPESDPGRPAYSMYRSASERSVSRWKEELRGMVEKAVNGLDKSLSQDKGHAEEVGRALASLKELDEPYQADGSEQQADIGPKREVVKGKPNGTATAKSVNSDAQLKSLLAEKVNALKAQGWTIKDSGCETKTFPDGSAVGTIDIRVSKDGQSDSVSFKYRLKDSSWQLVSLDTGGVEKSASRKDAGRSTEEARRHSGGEAAPKSHGQQEKEDYLGRANSAVAAQSKYDEFLKLKGNRPQEIFNKTVANDMLLELGKDSRQNKLPNSVL